MDYDADSIFPRNKTGRDSNIRNMFDKGKVVEVLCDETQVACRVQFLDKQGLISKPIPVKQFGSRSTSAFWCPKIGDDVSICRAPNSESGDWFIDGSFYNSGNPPPITDPDTRHVGYADGSVFEYTEKSVSKKSGVVQKRGTVSTPKGAGSGTLTWKGVGPIDVSTPSDTTIICANLVIQGNVQITGDVTITGKLTVNGDTTVNGDISNSGNINTTGVHRDALGLHTA